MEQDGALFESRVKCLGSGGREPSQNFILVEILLPPLSEMLRFRSTRARMLQRRR